jgi:peptidyl-tRNA hydrolase
MNIHKLLKKAESFLNEDERRRKEKRKYLKHVIKKLKKHEMKLIEQLDSEVDEATRDTLEKEITLAHAHRKKGLKVLKELKKAKKS